MNGLEINLECAIITFNHGFSVLNVGRVGHKYRPRAATNVKHLKPVLNSYIIQQMTHPLLATEYNYPPSFKAHPPPPHQIIMDKISKTLNMKNLFHNAFWKFCMNVRAIQKQKHHILSNKLSDEKMESRLLQLSYYIVEIPL